MRHDERLGSGFLSQLLGLGREWLVVLHEDRRESLLGGRPDPQLDRVGFVSQLERFEEPQLFLDGFGLQLETDSQLGPESQLERFGLESQLGLGFGGQRGGGFGLQLGLLTESQLGSGSQSDSQC